MTSVRGHSEKLVYIILLRRSMNVFNDLYLHHEIVCYPRGFSVRLGIGPTNINHLSGLDVELTNVMNERSSVHILIRFEGTEHMPK